MRRYFRPLYSLSQFNVNSLFLMKGHKYFLYRKNKTWSSVSNSSFLFEFIQKFRLFLVAGKKSTLCLFAINFVSEKYFCRKINPQKFLVPKKSTPRLAVLTIESILVGDNCHQDKCCMRKSLCDSCP